MFIVICTFNGFLNAQILFPDLLVDVGHGGTDAGNLTVFVSPIVFHEREINEKVAAFLKDTLEAHGYVEDVHFYFILTSPGAKITVYERAELANFFEAKALLSIHHNSFDTTKPVPLQGMQAFYNQSATIPSDCSDNSYIGTSRDITKEFAKKVVSQLFQKLKTNGLSRNNRGADAEYFALNRCTFMPSTIAEASFINGRWFPDEAHRYYYDSAGHVGKEALALFSAWRSFVTGQGFGQVEYAYSGLSPSDQTAAIIDNEEFGIPFEANWMPDEHHILQADPSFELTIPNSFEDSVTQSSYSFVFHHWEKLWFTAQQQLVVETHGISYWDVIVPYDPSGYHYYVAYYTGGPFDVIYQYPTSVDSVVQKGSQKLIKWYASEGARSSCSLKVEVSYNNGSSWSTLAEKIPYKNGFSFGNNGQLVWDVPNIDYAQCKLRITASDKAANFRQTTSSTFRIGTPGCLLPDADATVSDLNGACFPRAKRFSDESTNSPTLSRWKFHDGLDTTGTQIVRGLYPGNYSVWHWATNACGTDSIQKFYTVSGCPTSCTSDLDADGIKDGCDNCIVTPNPNQADADSNLTGDVCCCVGPVRGNVDMSPDNSVNIADLTMMTDLLFINVFNRYPCPVEANVDLSPEGVIDIGDLTVLVDHLLITFQPLPSCGTGLVEPLELITTLPPE